MDEETFQTAMDRVAASPDFDQVREGCLLYLKRDMKELPAGLGTDQLKKVKKRRKVAIRTFEKMEMLNMVREEHND